MSAMVHGSWDGRVDAGRSGPAWVDGDSGLTRSTTSGLMTGVGVAGVKLP